MINSIIVTNHLGESVTMELRFPEKSGFLILDVEGLGPTKADINVTDLAAHDGSIYNSARANSRNLVFTLGFLDKPDIETARHNSYKYFPLKKRIKLEFQSDTRTCMTYGYVESNEISVFNSSEYATISVICPSAYLQTVDNAIFNFSGTVSEFEFPFSNESLAEKLLVMGSITNLSEKSVFYEGDAETGVEFYLHANGPISNLKITDVDTLKFIRIDDTKLTAITGSGIALGDDIFISTIKGEKRIYLSRGVNSYNILNAVGKDVVWFDITKGDNIFAFTADSGIANLQIRVESPILYEGL